MALANYTDLQASVASWLHRSDLTTQIVDFITMAESRLNRQLRLRAMEADETLTTVIDSRSCALPDRFVEPIECEIMLPNGNTWDPLYKSIPEEMSVTTVSGRPCYWTIDGETVAFERPLDQAYNMRLRCFIGFDLASTTTNWLMTNHPDLYLYGTLLEAPIYLRDESRLALWQERFDRALDQVMTKDRRSRRRPLNTEVGLYHNSRRTTQRLFL